MTKKQHTSTSKPSNDEDTVSNDKDTVRIDFDFDFKFYASPSAKQLFQWLSHTLKWLLPLCVTFLTLHSAGVKEFQIPQTPASPSIEAHQPSKPVP